MRRREEEEIREHLRKKSCTQEKVVVQRGKARAAKSGRLGVTYAQIHIQNKRLEKINWV